MDGLDILAVIILIAAFLVSATPIIVGEKPRNCREALAIGCGVVVLFACSIAMALAVLWAIVRLLG